MDFSKAALNAAGLLLLAGSISFFAGCQYNRCADKGDCCGSCSSAAECKEKCADKGKCCGSCSSPAECKEKCGDKAACKDGAKAQALNKICPIGEHEADGTITASHNGKTVSFCCNDCKEAFAGKTDAEKAELVAKAYAAK